MEIGSPTASSTFLDDCCFDGKLHVSRTYSKPVVGPLRTAWVILQGLVEGGKCPTAEFIKITAADPELGSDLGNWDAAQEVQDGCDPLGHLAGRKKRHGVHSNF